MILILAGIILLGVCVVEILIFFPEQKLQRYFTQPEEEEETYINDKKESMEDLLAEEVVLKVPAFCQIPLLPTGYESCSAAMALNFIGVETDMETSEKSEEKRM